MRKPNFLQADDERAGTVLSGYASDVELAPILNVPVATLRHWRLVGDGPEFLKFGRSVRYSLRSVQAWVESRPRGGTGA